MTPVNDIFAAARQSWANTAALVLLSMAITISALYPDTFITGAVPIFGTSKLLPLNLFLPFMAVGAAAYAIIRRSQLKPGLVDAAVLAFLAFVVARNIATPGALPAVKYLIYGAGTYYLATLITMQRNSLSRSLVLIISGLTLFTALYGFAEYAAQENIIYHSYIQEIVPEPVRGLHRIGSTLAHPVAYAGFLVQAIPFCVAAWVRAGSVRGRMAGALAATLGSLALFLTYSKGSWIVAVIIAGITGLVLIKRSRKQFLIVAAIVLAGVALLTTIFWNEINLETSTRAGQSVNARLVAWEAATDGIRQNWPLGVGLREGNSEVFEHLEEVWPGVQEPGPPVDNFYLNVFLEEGIIGIGLWLAAVVLMLKEGIEVIRNGGPARVLALAALVSLVAILLNAVTFDALLNWPNYILFWLAAGVLHGIAWRQAPAHSH